MRRRWGWARWGTGGLGLVVAALAVFYGVWWGKLLTLPRLAQRRAEIHGGHYVAVSQVSPWFAKALIATEDHTFYTNWGISFEGIGRALVVDIEHGAFVQGGSTLTQELIRDLLLSPVKTIPRKATGSLLSLAATALYSKEQILTMYVNEVYLGHGAYGIDAAATRYFHEEPSALTLPQAAMLAGLPLAPSALNPVRHWSAAKARQRVVLSNMVSVHFLTAGQAHQASRVPLTLYDDGRAIIR